MKLIGEFNTPRPCAGCGADVEPAFNPHSLDWDSAWCCSIECAVRFLDALERAREAA